MSEYRMRIAVCDDDALDLQTVITMTQDITEQEGIPCELTGYRSGAELLEAIRSGERYTLLLLDVMIGESSGIALAAELRRMQEQTAIVFISSNREMAMYGYEVAAARYLAKPVDREKLREALQFCWRSVLAKQKLALPTSRGVRRIAPAELVYAETWGRGIRVTLASGQEEVGMKISDLEELLPGRQFVMCHRAYLVNLDYVQYLRYCELELKTGDTLPVSKYRQNVIRERLMNYLET